MYKHPLCVSTAATGDGLAAASTVSAGNETQEHGVHKKQKRQKAAKAPNSLRLLQDTQWSPICNELTLLTDSRSFSPSGSSPPCLAKPLTTCAMPLRLLVINPSWSVSHTLLTASSLFNPCTPPIAKVQAVDLAVFAYWSHLNDVDISQS